MVCLVYVCGGSSARWPLINPTAHHGTRCQLLRKQRTEKYMQMCASCSGRIYGTNPREPQEQALHTELYLKNISVITQVMWKRLSMGICLAQTSHKILDTVMKYKKKCSLDDLHILWVFALVYYLVAQYYCKCYITLLLLKRQFFAYLSCVYFFVFFR